MRASYPTYKSTSIPWPECIPESWELVKISSVFRERRETVSDKDFAPLSVTMQGIVPQLETAAKTDNGDNRKKVCAGDFVINSRSDRKGSAGISPLDGSVSVINTVLIPNEKIDRKYAGYLLTNYYFREEFYRYGKGIVADLWSTKYAYMKGMFIPLPPLPEQTAIANYLDAKTEQINRFIEKKEKLIALLKEQKQAVINKAVTKGIRLNVPVKDSGVEWLGDIPSHWKVIKLKYIANAIIGVTYSPNDIVDEQKGILVLRSSNIQNGRLSFLDNVFIKKEIPQKLLTRKGDILLCARNGSADLIGKNVCIDDSAVGLTFGAFMTIVRSKYWSYLSWFFNSSIFKSQTGLFATSTINQLTSDTLNNLKIAFPTDSSEREEIIKALEIETQQIDLGIEKIEKEIEKVKELKQSLIAEVVTGKIKVA